MNTSVRVNIKHHKKANKSKMNENEGNKKNMINLYRRDIKNGTWDIINVYGSSYICPMQEHACDTDRIWCET